MRSLPPLTDGGRVTDAVLVVATGVGQAAALAVAAFATRDAFAALHSGTGLSIQTILKLALSALVAAACLLLSRRHAEALGQSYAIALRRVLYDQIAHLPKARHEQRRIGALALRFVGDLSAARLWFGRGLPDVLSALVILPGAMAILFALDPALAGAGLVPLGLAMAIMCATAWHLEYRHRQLRSRRANIAITMIERIAIAPELDTMGRTDKELRALDEQGASLKEHAVARRGRTAGLLAILQAGVAMSGLAMLWLASTDGTAPATVAACLSVLALVALPLQDLGSAWDSFCAWRVAREKAQNLLDEPTLKRPINRKTRAPAAVTLRGKNITFHAPAGEITRLRHPMAPHLARLIAGLDEDEELDLRFPDHNTPPKVSFIDDTHIGLQGSLRRSATLIARKRPKDTRITAMLNAFGLEGLAMAPRGLDQRIAENGKGLTAAQTLRLDLVRAVLGRAEIIVISSVRWSSDPHQDAVLKSLRELSSATIILADTEKLPKVPEHLEVT